MNQDKRSIPNQPNEHFPKGESIGLNPFEGAVDPARKQMYGSKLTDEHGGSGVICEVHEPEPFVASDLVYPAHIVLGGDGRFIVSFRDVPEAITQGDDFTEMMEMAIDCLATAIEFYLEDNRPLAMPSAFEHGEIGIALSVANATLMKEHNAKLAGNAQG